MRDNPLRKIAIETIQSLNQLGLSVAGSYPRKSPCPLIRRLFSDILCYPHDWWKIRTSFFQHQRRNPKLVFPRTFNEKLQQSKLIRRKKIYKVFADKIAVRNYVTQKIGSEHLTKLYWTGNSLYDLNTATLPKEFVIKANHTSGSNLIIDNKDNCDWDHIRKVTKQWLSIDFSRDYAEWQYRWIEPKLLIEERLSDNAGKVPNDYKFFCFSGKVRIIQVDFDRTAHHTRLLFNQHFEKLDCSLEYDRYDGVVAKPDKLQEMIQIAECLADKEPFLRIDLYALNPIKFGEITIHPGSGRERFTPTSWDHKLAEYFD